MRKKILIYLGSLAVTVLIFWWIKNGFFGSSSWHAPRQPIRPVPVYTHKGVANLVVEVRNPRGVLQYVLRARQALPQGNGRYLLTEPRMQFYSAGNQTTIIASDMGDVYVDQVGGTMSSQIYPRKGTLMGHPTITMGPLQSFIPGTRQRMAGQVQIRLSHPVTFNYQQGLIISHGDVHLRSDQADFDGVGLTAEVNMQQKHLDYLRIDKGIRLILRNVAGKTAPVASGLQPSTNSNSPISGPVAPTTARITSLPSSRQATTSVHSAPIIYRLDFMDHVEALIRRQNIRAHRFIVYFSGGSTANPAAPPPLQTTTAAPPPATSTTLGSGPTSRTATTQSGRNDLYVTWTGPMLMRPQKSGSIHLLGPKDAIFQAWGRSGHPVQMRDGHAMSALANELTYETQSQILTLIPATGTSVLLRDMRSGSAACHKLTFNRLTNIVVLDGPGTAAIQSSQSKLKDQTPWHVSWRTSVMLSLLQRPQQDHQDNITLALRRAEISGHAHVQNSGMSIRGDRLIAWLAQTGDPHQPQALSRMLARGNVRVSSWNNAKGKQIDRNNMSADQLTITSAILPGSKIPQPHSLLASGDVHLDLTQVVHTANQRPTRYKIITPRLNAILVAQTAKSGPQTPEDVPIGRFTVTHFHADHGVRITILSKGQPIVARAIAMHGNRQTGSIEFTGGTATTPDDWASIDQHGNLIAGPDLILHQKQQSIFARGPGRFLLRQHTADQTGATKPGVQILWQDSMTYNGKNRHADFLGGVTAKLLARSDQKSLLSCNKLTVMLDQAVHKIGDTQMAKGQLRLTDLMATAKPGTQLSAMDASFGPTGLLRTRLYLQSKSLHYNALRQRLTVAGAGQMSLEDYRGQTAANRTTAAKTTTAAPLGSQRGQSAFAWKRSLRYHATTGVLSLLGKVRMVYKPEHAPTIANASTIGGENQTASTTSRTGPNAGLVLLDCHRLMATLEHLPEKKPSAVELGMGGPMKLRFVQAQQAAMELLGIRLAADVLTFDALNQKAIAFGLNGHDAILSSNNGQAHGQAKKIIWDVNKGRSGLTFIQPHGTVSGH